MTHFVTGLWRGRIYGTFLKFDEPITEKTLPVFMSLAEIKLQEAYGIQNVMYMGETKLEG